MTDELEYNDIEDFVRELPLKQAEILANIILQAKISVLLTCLRSTYGVGFLEESNVEENWLEEQDRRDDSWVHDSDMGAKG